MTKALEISGLRPDIRARIVQYRLYFHFLLEEIVYFGSIYLHACIVGNIGPQRNSDAPLHNILPAKFPNIITILGLFPSFFLSFVIYAFLRDTPYWFPIP